MESSSRAGAGSDPRRQQEAVADLSRLALERGELDQLLDDAASAVVEALDTDYCAVLERGTGADEYLLRHGDGWRSDVAAATRTTLHVESADALVARTPLVFESLQDEPALAERDVLTEHDVAGGAVVRIGPAENHWGLLAVFTTDCRVFGDGDVSFLQSVANVLASSIQRKRAQSELDEIYGRISDAFIALDEEWRLTHLNQRAQELINPEGRELIGKHVWDEFPEAVGRAFKEKYEQAMYEQETVSFEEYYPEPLDTWFEVRAYPSETGLSIYFRDVSERKEREQELQREERRYQAVFEDPNILVGLLDPDGTVIDINQTAMEYVDADLDTVTGKPFWETPWWGEADALQKDVEQWVERAADGEYVDFEADLTQPGGEKYVVSGNFRPVTNEEGDVVSIIASDRDITERRERERELEESERRYRALVENFPNGAVALVDEDVRYQTVGGDPQGVADVTVDEVEGSLVAEVLPDELADELAPRYEAALETGAADAFEIRLDDSVYQFQVVPVRDEDGEVFAALGMSQDVTEREEAKRQLEESERRYRTLVENFPNGTVGLFDEDLEYTALGGELLDEVGVDTDDRVGNSVSDVYPDELVETLAPNFEAALDGEASSFEFAYHDRDLFARTVPVTNGDGEVFAGMLMVQDVTERKEYERKLEESERRYRTLAEHFPNGAVGVYDEDLRYTLAEGAMLGETLPSSDRLQGDRMPEIFPADTVDDLEPLFRAAVEEGETGSTTTEFIGRNWRVWTTPLRDGDGEIFAGLSFAQDITDQVEREQALRESKRQLRTLIELLPVAVFVAEEDGEIVEWNEAAEEIWGGEIAESESVAEYERYDGWWADTGEPVEPDEWALARALRGEEVTDPDVIEIEGFDGERRTILNHGMPVRDEDGEVSRAVVTLTDITKRKEYQRELEESNERLEQFAYAASHDLQEPLRMVSSYLQLIERRYGDELDEDGREFIEYAVDGAERMRDMIDGLLEYSRVETRGDPFEPVDVNDVLADVRDDLRVKIEETDAEITAESLPEVEGDREQLRQVFQNLVDNAIEYSGDEPPRVHVSAERGGDQWRFSVRDDGVGIDPDDADRIFEVFQRLHAPSEHDGTGIGLALCERIVERHDGDIWVESEPGEGSTFTFTLPATGDADA